MIGNFNYDTFRKKKVTEKIKREMDFFGKYSDANISAVKNYLEYLDSRIYGKQLKKLRIFEKFWKEAPQVEKLDMDEYGKDMDILMFKKPWSKLREFHKIMKIKEFVQNLEYETESENIDKNKKQIVEKIIDGIRTKKFGKNKSEIIYDPEQMMVTSISCLQYSKRSGLYKVVWND